MSKSTATEKYITANSGKKISEVTDEEKLGDIDSNSQQGKDILSAYSAAQLRENSIETAHKNQELAATKAYDLSQKYMAAQNEANGLSGLGIADTTAIRASSQYQNALADAYATREQSLTDNYAKLQDDVGTIRGQWASIKEAEKQDVMDNALAATSWDAVNAYLDAAIESGKIKSEDKASALNSWALVNNTTVGKIEDEEQAAADKATALADYGANANYEYDPSQYVDDYEALAEKIKKNHNIGDGWFDNQDDSLRDFFKNTANWGSDKNGTYVDFNDGAGQDIFVFYNGKWYPTSKTKEDLEDEDATLYGVDDDDFD